jgi:uncharacterized protein
VPPEKRAALVQQYHESGQARRRVEDDLRSELGCAPGELIIYCPALTVMKEAAAKVHIPEGICALNAAPGSGRAEIQALEERYAGLWRFYVFVPAHLAARTAAAAEERFGFPSEHTARRGG